jgi:hypothetical protein
MASAARVRQWGRTGISNGKSAFMGHFKRTAVLTVTGIALVALVAGAFFFVRPTTHAAPSGNRYSKTVPLTALGTTSFSGSQAGTVSTSTTAQGERGPETPEGDVHQTASTNHVTLPSPTAKSVSNASGASGFAGVDHFDSRSASHGNQFSLEPPDQGLCVGSGFLLEPVNDALAAYSLTDPKHTRVAGPTALNAFFNLPPAIKRSAAGGITPGTFGPFISDPKCYYDAGLNRWFLTVLELDVNPADGSFTGGSHTLIAVSQTSSPVGKYALYSIDTTNDGTNGTPNDPGCPCFGDQPLIGADANGFYISNNEFPVFNNGFNGTQLYAISKAGLANAYSSHHLPTVGYINVGNIATPDAGGIWYTLQPAETPPGGAYESANGGTEYLLSALDFFGYGDTRIATWALTGTSSLSSSSPSLGLSYVIVNSEAYSNTPTNNQPFAATQKAGSIPLGDLAGNSEELLNANDDRMNQVVFADGMLWSGVNTVTATNTVAAAYFIVTPSDPSGTLSATMTKQGYVAAGNDSVLFPSIGVNAQGKGVIVFTLTGPDYYPSAAYAPVDATNGAGNIVISGAGVGPDDGFTGYPNIVGGDGVGRWGDYSAAVAGLDGSIWTATEYIGQSCTLAEFEADSTCGGTRTLYANWGTYVDNVRP